MTAASLSGRDRATCLNHNLPPSERRLSLSAMSSESSASCDADAQTSVCPVRALRIYIDRLDSFRQSDQLFECYGGWAKGRAVSKQRLSHWIVDAIKAAYTSQGLECPLHIRAHSTRATIKRYVYSGYMLSSRLVFSEYLRQVLQAGRSVLSLTSAVGEYWFMFCYLYSRVLLLAQ